YFHRPARRHRLQRLALFEILVTAPHAPGVLQLETRSAELKASIHRFVRDRSSLSPVELDDLMAGLRRDPAAASLLRTLLQQSDLPDQERTPGRGAFLEVLSERLVEEAREQLVLTRQVLELRTADVAARSAWSA